MSIQPTNPTSAVQAAYDLRKQFQEAMKPSWQHHDGETFAPDLNKDLNPSEQTTEGLLVQRDERGTPVRIVTPIGALQLFTRPMSAKCSETAKTIFALLVTKAGTANFPETAKLRGAEQLMPAAEVNKIWQGVVAPNNPTSSWWPFGSKK